MTKQQVKHQPLLPKLVYAAGSTSEKFEKCFTESLNVTRAYTLSRDVKDCIAAALRRENRSE